MNTPNNQVTLIQVIDILESIASSHGQIEAFFCGDLANFHPGDSIYPLMYVNYNTANLNNSQMEYDMEIYILDRIETDYNYKQINETFSDTLQILCDVKTQLRFGTTYYNLFRSNSGNVFNDNSQFTKRGDKINEDFVSGWSMQIKLSTDYLNNQCAIPQK